MTETIKSEIQFWQRFAKRYDLFIRSMAMKTYSQVFALIADNINKGDKVLEAATGTGLISFEIYNKAHSIIAFDLSSEMIKVAREKQKSLNVNNINFEVADIYNLEMDGNEFDIVIASNIFHLLESPNIAMGELARVTKSDGRIIISTVLHSHNLLSKIISFFMELSGIKVNNKWTAKSYRAFIESCGMSVNKEIFIKDLMPSSLIIASKSNNTNLKISQN